MRSTVLLSLVVLALVPGVATAQTGWSEPRPVSPTFAEMTAPLLALHLRGSALTVRGPAGTRELARGAISAFHAVAFTPDGRAIAAWIQELGGRQRVRVAVQPRGGRFGAPRTLVGGGGPAQVAVAVGAGGDLALVVQRQTDVVARVRRRGGRWGALQRLDRRPSPTYVERPMVAIDARGDVQALWQTSPRPVPSDTPPHTVRTAFAPAGRGFGAPTTVTTHGDQDPQLTSTGAGFLLVHAESLLPQGYGVSRLFTTERRGGGRFAPRAALGPDAPLGTAPQLAVNPRSQRIAVGWNGQVAIRPLAGPFGPLEAIPGAGAAATLVPRADGFGVYWESPFPAAPHATTYESVHP